MLFGLPLTFHNYLFPVEWAQNNSMEVSGSATIKQAAHSKHRTETPE